MKKLLLIGGDRRMACLAERLEAQGFAVDTMGLRPRESIHHDGWDAILFAYPFSVKNGLIPTLNGETLKPETALANIKQEPLLITGKGMEGYIRQDLPNLKRYTDAKNFEQRNAELSAEAAVCEAMLHCRPALMDANVLVTGYGLFGRAIALRLKALGAQVWIAARREQQRLQAIADGMQAVSIVEMAEVLPQMDLILNTVPARIFGEYHLKRIPKDCWLLELASAPYGFDADTAKAMGAPCVNLPGLPARYSPESAARILYDAVMELMGEAGK